jgi:hypothetical protein
LWHEIKLHIDHPNVDLERAMVRLWALLTWIFDKTNTQKIMCSSNYRYAKQQQIVQIIGQKP